MRLPSIEGSTASTPGIMAAPAGSKDVYAKRLEVREFAKKYRSGRFNVFFREKEFIEDFQRGGLERLGALEVELEDTRELMALPADTQFLEGQPEIVLERMSMIDILHEVAKKEPVALESMVALARQPIDNGLSTMAKKAVVGEKYDLLFRIAQLDRELAIDTYLRLDSDKLRRLLRDALVTGLAEGGAPPDEVRRLMQQP